MNDSADVFVTHNPECELNHGLVYCHSHHWKNSPF
jgi:hypothetical protein